MLDSTHSVPVQNIGGYACDTRARVIEDCIANLTFNEDEDSLLQVTLPPPVRIKPVLRQLGFAYLGRARPGKSGKDGSASPQHRFYSRNPGIVRKAGGLQKFVLDRLAKDELSFN